ncbi:MAG: hypothetical protein F4X55_02655 [Candidatus Dadabacteria bacterium]|nr:hypothetical protein [Candidatus Dadabacteria bacterium]MYC39901.1 hypothetical protein [Candidatus Dadabacteria bacterium]
MRGKETKYYKLRIRLNEVEGDFTTAYYYIRDIGIITDSEELATPIPEEDIPQAMEAIKKFYPKATPTSNPVGTCVGSVWDLP